MNKGKSLVTLVLLVALCAGGLFGVNKFTAPIIEANNAGAALGILKEVMPEGAGFELLYDVNDPASSTLVDVAETVEQVYVETSGKGYVVNLSTTQGYTHEAIKFTVGVDAEGKICGVKLTAYPETKDFSAEKDYPSTYIGQDSSLAGVELVANVTFSSSAFKNATNDGFTTLIANNLVGAGVKSSSQVFGELLPTVATGFANHAGILQVEEAEVGFAVKTFVAKNNSNIAYIVTIGGADYLVVVNTTGNATVFDIEGNEVELEDEEIDNCITVAKEKLANTIEKDQKKVAKLTGSENLTVVELGNTHSSVTTVFAVDGGKQYAVVTRPYHYSNEPVAYYFIINANGEIVKMTCEEFILHSDYFSAYELDESSYKAGFVGLNSTSLTEDVTLVSGATFTSKATYVAARDSLAAIETIKGGN